TNTVKKFTGDPSDQDISPFIESGTRIAQIINERAKKSPISANRRKFLQTTFDDTSTVLSEYHQISSITKDGFLLRRISGNLDIVIKGADGKPKVEYLDSIFVRCPTEGLIDGPLRFNSGKDEFAELDFYNERIGGRFIWPTGTLTYTTVANARKTIWQYTVDPSDKDIRTDLIYTSR
ncbi:hypothetical protein OAH21_01575, partial [bacterium]|nr:hypothetical protein [bacterium]